MLNRLNEEIASMHSEGDDLTDMFIYIMCVKYPILGDFPANIYYFKGNKGYTRKICEMRSKLAIKTTEWRQWYFSGVFIVDFEQVNAGWEAVLRQR